jgi:hypothetical protein
MGYRLTADGAVHGVIHYAGPGHPAEFKSSVRTRFVRDRIAEVPWNARAYIGDLVFIEQILITQGPHSMAAGMAWHRLQAFYPIEVTAIRKELERGVYMPPEMFALRDRYHAEAEARRREQARVDVVRAHARAIAHTRDLWRQLGGRC